MNRRDPVNRRDLLRTLAAGRGTADDREADGERGGTTDGAVLPDGGSPLPGPGEGRVSLRTVAERLDRDRPARRLFGNGPPFDPDRPGAYDLDELSFGDVTVDVDDPEGPANPPDPPTTVGVEGPVDAGHLHDKVTYRGVRYLDAPDGSPPSGTVEYRTEVYPGTYEVYLQNLFFADYNAYDLGMVNRTADNTTLPAGYTDKGIVESHRFRPSDGSGTGPPAYHSIRSVTDRHERGVWHRLGWQNVQLPLTEGDREERARAFGELFASLVIDVVGMCELASPRFLETVEESYADWYPAIGRAFGDPSLDDLGVLVGERNLYEPAVNRNLVDADSEAFEEAGPAFTGANKEGWQRAVVEIPSLPGDPRFEVYLTHLQAVIGILDEDKPQYEDRKQQAKLAQLRELVDVVRESQRNHPERPRVVMGDFNIHSRKRGALFDQYSGVEDGRYFPVLMDEMHSIGMQDAWLSHGGPGPADKDCNQGLAGFACDPFEPEAGESREEYYRGDRLDYVFVEEPRDDHALRLDVSRTKAFSWDHREYGFLSDHEGLYFDLLTSPAD